MNNLSEKLEKLRRIRLFVLDMDGTITIDNTAIGGAVQFCEAVKNKGASVAYFTNNASKSPSDYVKKLKRIGFPVSRENMITSGDVTINYLNTFHKGEPVYLVGTPELERSFLSAGIKLSDNAEIVVSSFDTTLTYKKLEHACSLIRNGALFYSTHPDVNCPTTGGFIPDSGAICAAIELSTGVKPRFFGKPYKESADMLCRISGLEPSEIAFVGDRLYTDIAFGKRAGFLSVLVLTGETSLCMLEGAPDEQTPDLVFDGIYDILEFLN